MTDTSLRERCLLSEQKTCPSLEHLPYSRTPHPLATSKGKISSGPKAKNIDPPPTAFSGPGPEGGSNYILRTNSILWEDLRFVCFAASVRPATTTCYACRLAGRRRTSFNESFIKRGMRVLRSIDDSGGRQTVQA